MLRAALGVSNNIAEGFERRSRKEFLQFLAIAKGSCGEVKSMLIVAKETGITNAQKTDPSIRLTEEIGSLLYLLMKSLNEPQFKTSEAKEPEPLYLSSIVKEVSQDMTILANHLFHEN